jgi:CelD/BcsL family acetyltransferase involved in cellulose biosynthesis
MNPRPQIESGFATAGESQIDASLAFEVLEDLAEIDRVSAEWEAVLDASDCNRAFSSPKWYEAWCRLDPVRLPYVIVARRRARMAGLLPLVIDEQTATFQNMLTDYNDIVVLEGDLAAAVGLIRHAATEPKGYDRVRLQHLRADSICTRAVQAIDPRGAAWRFQETHTCYYASLSGAHEDYLRSRGSRFRKRLKRLETIAARMKLVVRELPAPGLGARCVARDFLSLHLGRFGEESCFSPGSARSFVSEVIPELMASGRMRAIGLMEGQRIVGVDLYTMGKSSLCAWNGGFVSEVEECSPGKLLIGAGIRLAFERRLSEYDFLRGTEVYKESWADKSRSLGTLELAVG